MFVLFSFSFGQPPVQQPNPFVSSPSAQEDYNNAIWDQSMQNFLNTSQQNAIDDANTDPTIVENPQSPQQWPQQGPVTEQQSQQNQSAQQACGPLFQAPLSNGWDRYQKCLTCASAPWANTSRCFCSAWWWIVLNTNVPFVGNCIMLRKNVNTANADPNTTVTDPTNAFPRLLAGLTKITMTVILIFCFMAIIVWGVLISMGWASEAQATKGKELIRHVIMALALLGASGVILRIINPSFFS